MRQEVTRFTQNTGVKAAFGVSGQVRVLPPDIEDPLLRICQEALTNVRRHANANSVMVTLRYNDERVTLTVQDNGVGFDPRAPLQGRFGLLGMRERARLIGGAFEVESEPNRGTVVRVAVPTGR
jgi:signal transduction histidine kinase